MIYLKNVFYKNLKVEGLVKLVGDVGVVGYLFILKVC